VCLEVCLEVYFHTSCKSLSCCRETERERERGAIQKFVFTGMTGKFLRAKQFIM